MRSPEFLTLEPHARRTLGALLTSVLVLAIVAPVVLAGGPHVVRPPAPPLNRAAPHFVTETNERKWDDCEWASAAMLIEKWTGHRVDRRALRAAAYVRPGASSLSDVARGTAVLLGLHLRYSPNGGDPMTWSQLLARLADGGGAVLEGAYSRLPRWYSRWDRKFANSGARKSGHAVYVERYEPRRGRVWLMDPLGQGDYNGEWISVWDLAYFASTSGGLVYAAATPARIPPDDLSKVEFGQPAFVGDVLAGSPATLVVPILRDRKAPPRLATLRVSTVWVKVDSSTPDGPIVLAAPPLPPTSAPLQGVGQPSAALDGGLTTSLPSPPTISPLTPAPFVTGSPTGVRVTARGWRLVAQVVVPIVPGRYRLTVVLRDAAGKPILRRIVKPFTPTIVSVQGPYRVSFAAPATLGIADRSVSFGVANIGTGTWAVPSGTSTTRIGDSAASAPQVIADWLFADGSTMVAGGVTLDLAPGGSVTVALPLGNVPTDAVALRLDLVGPDGTRVSELGGRATIIPLTPTTSPARNPT